MNVDDRLIELAENQHCLVNRKDAARVMTSRQWCRRVDAGDWIPVAPGVWCHRATSIDWRLQARAGVQSLGQHSALYGRTAAAWWKLEGIDVTDVEFVVPRRLGSRSFPFVVHIVNTWQPDDLMVHDGVALILDTGGDSYLERRFLGLVRHAGLPRPSCQVVHRADGKRIARVDFQFPGTNVIVEVSGRLGHVSDRDRQRDARRRNALQQSGHIVLEFTTADVMDAQDYVIDTLVEQLPEQRPAQVTR